MNIYSCLPRLEECPYSDFREVVPNDEHLLMSLQIRGMSIDEAIKQLAFHHRKGAAHIKEVCQLFPFVVCHEFTFSCLQFLQCHTLKWTTVSCCHLHESMCSFLQFLHRHSLIKNSCYVFSQDSSLSQCAIRARHIECFISKGASLAYSVKPLEYRGEGGPGVEWLVHLPLVLEVSGSNPSCGRFFSDLHFTRYASIIINGKIHVLWNILMMCSALSRTCSIRSDDVSIN